MSSTLLTPPFRLLTLGGLALETDDGVVTGAASQPRRLALLALVAAHGRAGLLRDRVLGILWPELNEERARGALAQLRYVMRRDLGADLLGSGPTLRLEPTLVSTDRDALECAFLAGDAEAVAARYAGPWLSGMFLAHAPEFERWAESERAALHARVASMLRRAARAADATHCSAAWQRVRALDPVDGEAALALVEALVEQGDAAGALRVAREHAEARARELELPPDPAVERAAAVARNAVARTPTTPDASGTDGPVHDVSAEPQALETIVDAPIASVEEATRARPAAADAEPFWPTEPPMPSASSSRWRRRVWGGALTALALAALSVVALRRTRLDATHVPILAVLPFENLGAPGDAYFAEGLTDEVRSRLTAISGLRVIGGGSARHYKGTTKSPREIARELGATHLLTGSVRWERTAGGGRVRVRPELIRGVDQASIWAEPIEGPLGDVFAMQARVAERVAGALDVKLMGGERRAAESATTQSLAAYDAYLRGLAYGTGPNRLSASARRSYTAAMEEAVALDPRFAAAHARLATAYVRERSFGYDNGDLMEKAAASVARAMALDSTIVETQYARATYLIALHDDEGAYQAFRHAERIAPGNSQVLVDLAGTLEKFGRLDEAVTLYRRAERIDPGVADAPGQLSGAYDRMFRYKDAIAARERAIAIAPSEGFTYIFQAATYLLWRADVAAARRVLDTGTARTGLEEMIRLPSHFAGRAIWLKVVSPAVIHAKDTITLAGYTRSDWGTPDLYHLMKARHFALMGRPTLARAHAQQVIVLLEPVLRHGPGTGVLIDLFTPRSTIAEAYAYAGRPADAARAIDLYMDERRRLHDKSALNLPYALVSAAYVDVLIGRHDLAVARLEEALRLPSGQFISRALLRADPSWGPLRGHAAFERLIAGSP